MPIDWDQVADNADGSFASVAAAVQGHVERGTLRSIAVIYEYDEGDGHTNVAMYGGKSSYLQMLGLSKYLSLIVESEFYKGDVS